MGSLSFLRLPLLHGLYTCLLVLGYSFGSSANGQPLVPAVYVFGDSLVDVGNNNYIPTSILKANFLQNGVDYPGRKPTGRFSNGFNAADFVAEKVGLPSFPPYLSINVKGPDAFMRGVNFASGGAGVLTSTNNGRCLTLDNQIDYYSIVYTAISQQFGSTAAQAHFSSSIFATVVGSNDILNYLEGSKPMGFINSLLSKHDQQLRRLYGLGARKFLVVGIPPLGCCPDQRSKNKNGDCNVEANDLAVKFNEGVVGLLKGIALDLGDVNYSFFDTYISILQYVQNPTKYGFVEVKAACCGIGNLNANGPCLPFATLCSNRNDHLFWDFYHPTEIVVQKVVDAIFDGSLPYIFPVNLKQLVIV